MFKKLLNSLKNVLISLPEESKTYILNKYSKSQIKIFLSHLEAELTEKKPEDTSIISELLDTDTWADGLKNKLETTPKKYSQSDVLNKVGLFKMSSNERSETHIEELSTDPSKFIEI